MNKLLVLFQVSLSFALFILLFIGIRSLGQLMIRRRTARSRLSSGSSDSPMMKLPDRLIPLYLHLKDLTEAARLFRSVAMFVAAAIVLGLAGVSCGVILFRSLRGVAALGITWGLMPYLVLRLRLISGRLRTRLEFLPAVEVFYQQVLLAGSNPNMRAILQSAVAGDRLLYPIKPCFEQLSRNLSAGRNAEDALRVFRLELGHIWADYYANMLQMAINEGVDIAPNLKELIMDMRRAQLYDQRVRNRLLEIRVASFSPIFFLLLFLFINFKLNYEQSVQFYLLDSGGRNMLLNALLLIFGSFIMGIYLSMRRM